MISARSDDDSLDLSVQPTVVVQKGPLVDAIGPMVGVELERVEALELLVMVLAHLNNAEDNAEAAGDLSPRVPTLMAIRGKLAAGLRELP